MEVKEQVMSDRQTDRQIDDRQMAEYYLFTNPEDMTEVVSLREQMEASSIQSGACKHPADTGEPYDGVQLD